MKLFTLTEARKPRSAYKQELKQQVLGPVKGEKWDMAWREKVRQAFIDFKISHSYQRRIIELFELLAKQKGEDYFQRINVVVIRDLVKALNQKYELEAVGPKKSGASSAYTRALGVTYRHSPAAELQKHMADVDVVALKKEELPTHDHPLVRRLYNAISPIKDRHLQDQAVVWDLEGHPFYLFTRLHMTHPGAEKPDASGKRWFEAIIPRVLDYRGGRKLSEHDFEMYTKDTDWRKQMRSTSEMAVLHKFQTTNLDASIERLQTQAWEKARPWYAVWHAYLEAKFQRDLLDKEWYEKHTSGFPVEKQRQLYELNQLVDKYYAALTEGGKAPESYTWYLWLLIAEDEYGIRVPERQEMYPAYPRTPTAVKGLEPHWPVRPAQAEGGEPRWDGELLTGIGFGRNEWERFVRELKASRYKFYSSPKEIQRLMVPLVGKVRERFGVQLHPANITEYMDVARQAKKIWHKTGPVLGREGNVLTVHEGMPFPQYRFLGAGGREISLIPALGYLQYFDSPTHGGERLIHGRLDLEPPISKSIHYPAKSRAGKPILRGQATTRDATDLHFNPEQARQRRLRIEIAAAERIINLRNKRYKEEVARMARINQRLNDPHWRAPGPSSASRQQFIHRQRGVWEKDPAKAGRRFTIRDSGTTYQHPKHAPKGETTTGIHPKKLYRERKFTYQIRRQPLPPRQIVRPEFNPSRSYVPPPLGWEEYWKQDQAAWSKETKQRAQKDPKYLAELKAFAQQQHDQLVKDFHDAHRKGFIVMTDEPKERG